MRVGPVLPHRLHSEKHFSAEAPRLEGRMAAGRPKDTGPGTSVLSSVRVWCRVPGWTPDRTSTRRHGGAGVVSQAILYFNFRCIS